MATWKPENVLLTLKGNEALSKVLAGQGKLTVTRIVTGAGYVSPSTLYNQKNVSNIKQTLEISRVVTDANGSEISTTLSNINLDTAYSLYQIGVYCKHTDSDEEFLYLIAQCETDKPDTIPAKTDTIANFSYNLYIQHEGTTQFEVTVNQSGVLDVSMLGKPNGVAGLDSEGILPKEVIPNASKIYLSDGVTSVEEAIANSGGAFTATYGTTTSAEIEAAYQKGKAVFCSYSNKLIPLVVRVSATNHQFYTGSLYCDALGNTKGLFLLCNNSVWSNDAEVVPYHHSSMHSIDGSDPVVSYMIGAKSRDNLLVNSNWSNSENIVDQRGGYVVPPGVPSYSDRALTHSAGDTTGYRTVVETTSTYIAYIGSDGDIYYCAPGNAVRGYTGIRYGIDRWFLESVPNVNFVVELHEGFIRLIQESVTETNKWQALYQSIGDIAKAIAGKVITVSLLHRGTGSTQLYLTKQDTSNAFANKVFTNTADWQVSTLTATVPDDATDVRLRIYADVTGSLGHTDVMAVKLELGTKQTLAHRENSNWVLNDPPTDKGMELLRCRISTADPSDPFSNGSAAKMLYTGTLTTDGWVEVDEGYKQTISISGIKGSDSAIVGLVQTGTVETDCALIEGMSLVSRVLTEDDNVIAYAYGEKPAVALPIQILCVR